MQVTVAITTPSILPPELAGKRAFLLHDFQCDDDNFTAYYPRVCNSDGTPKLVNGKAIGLPETEKMGDAIFEPMDEARQFFWFELLTHEAKGTLTLAILQQRWSDLTAGDKFACNKHGGIRNPRTEKRYWDYINDTHYLTDAPMAQENLTTCGNMVILSGREKNSAGVTYKGVLCLDGTQLPTSVEIIAHPLYKYFIHRATTCRPEKANVVNFPRRAIAPYGTYVVNPFPHLGGLDVPVPFISSRGEQSELMGLSCRENWIAERRLVTLDDDESPSPYVR